MQNLRGRALIAWVLCAVVIVIARIISHQPRNVIGWLLMTPPWKQNWPGYSRRAVGAYS